MSAKKRKVEVFGAGCPACEEAIALDGLVWREVDVLDEFDYAVDLGVMALPAMAINGKLAFTTLPTAEQLRAELAKYI